MPTAPRLTPLDPPYEDALALALERIMPPGVAPLTLFRTLAVNRRVFDRLMAGGLLDRGLLSLREREILIDRTCACCKAWYEFDVHIAFFGRKTGLTDEQIRSLASPDAAHPTWTDRERLLIAAAEALAQDADLDEPLWVRLREAFGPGEILEIIALAGYYRTISSFVRALRLEGEDFAEDARRIRTAG